MAPNGTTGHRVAQARRRRGMSQRELARAAGLSQPTLSRVEDGSRSPRLPELLALARAMGTGLGELTENSPVRDRLVRLARTGVCSGSPGALQARMVHFFEVGAFLDEHGIPAR